MNNKKGLLLLNLGTPDSPEPKDVGRYLREFLMDKWVIDIAYVWRWILVQILIVPRRKFAASRAYKTIWGPKGSPLAYHLEDLKNAVKATLPEFHVASAMRYGNPSIQRAFEQFEQAGVSEIVVFALYPQYAESTSRSSQEECLRLAKKMGLQAKLKFFPAFYDHPEFIKSYAEILRPQIAEAKAAALQAAVEMPHLLMSFHGLPERHMKAIDRSGGNHCLQGPDCCDTIVEANRDCYRAQSYATARALARELKITDGAWSVSFQSRLGRTPWIRPYTDIRLTQMPNEGIKSVAVTCPSFAADCLETVEEIGDRGRHEFMNAGGITYSRLECPNASAPWVEAVAKMVRSF